MRPACRGATVVLGCAAAIAVSAIAGAVPGTVRQTSMPVPWSTPHPNVTYASIACASIGNCTTIGVRTTSLSQYVPASDTQHAGTWRKPIGISLPPGGQPVTFSLGFRSIACPRQGSCVAVGTYWDPSPGKGLQPMITRQRGGVWPKAATAFPLPFGSSMGELDAIWCRAVGTCVVTGSSWTSVRSSSRAFVVVERHGHWQQPLPLPAPKTGLPAPTAFSPSSIACTALSACVVVGEVTGSAVNGSQLGFADVQHGTNWASKVFTYSEHNGTVMDLASVSCPSSTTCVAVGSSGATAGTTKPLAYTYSRGHWQRGLVLPWQYFAPATFGGQLDSVSCPSRYRCVAVGQLQGAGTEATSSLGQLAVAYTWSSGHWSAPALIGAPATSGAVASGGAQLIPSGGAQLDAISCPTTRECEVVGTTTPSSVTLKGVYPYSATIAPVSAGSRPGAVHKIVVTTTNGTFNVSWDGPTTFGGSPIQTFTVVAHSANEPVVACATVSLKCTLGGIVKKHRYVVDVTPRNAAQQSGPTARQPASG